jgi:hypothetical protein
MTTPTVPLDIRSNEVRITGASFDGALRIQWTANNTLVFNHTGIGVILSGGPSNRISFGDQGIQALRRGGEFASDQILIPYGISVNGLPIMLSSSTADLQSIRIIPNINNNSLYTGITRGIYYNPTVTSLGSSNIHRAIETVSGDVIFGSSSGNVGIGTSTPSRKLDVSGSYEFVHNPLTELTTNNTGYGDIVTFGTGTTVAGSIYYYNSVGGWVLTDADFVSASTRMLGIALSTSPSSGMLLKGYFRNTGFTINTGDILYLSTTAGDLTSTPPSAAGDVIRIVGYCISGGTSDIIYFDPDKSWIEL